MTLSRIEYSKRNSLGVEQTETQTKPKLLLSQLPSDELATMDFRGSSFFKTNKSLPTTDEVMALSTYPHKTYYDPPPVIFDQLGLLVKFGQRITIAEAQCVWAMQELFGDKVPVPELFGWRVRNGLVFIYMQLVRGDTLADRWDCMPEKDRISICDELREIITSLRELRYGDTDQPFIGSINRQNVRDYIFVTRPLGGPFETLEQFHDWISSLPLIGLSVPSNYVDPYRSYLPDDATIKFTHADLHARNIIISRDNSPKILALIDWEQSGWYPEYWEWCKACYTSDCFGEWRNKWIPKIFTAYHDEFNVFAEYIHFMGAM
ncbi:phosphotransferase enzyme family protein [Nannizzia gypsea CBS 118893]|uniref:Phosphotransferase enzyme family protein n=1 Tax=Arthroderma gypseum (strain ATCC MYA-4604 / CBS 118893) TaxID=535722 RepID=E4UT04_ARTGP|nr:phosphotransferase enzyme family protein [Nannizzia gypsea CBS 118893]EFR00617.1 phosphotransferase enzyme family protein [Nannizzia gypsea CBS 118893]